LASEVRGRWRICSCADRASKEPHDRAREPVDLGGAAAGGGERRLRVQIDSWGSAIIGALVLGVVNAIIRPVLVFFTLPLTIVTLGLFLLDRTR
jgi:hypothetical protein